MDATHTSFETTIQTESGHSRLLVVLSDVPSVQEEEALLTRGIHDVAQFLVKSAGNGPDRSTIIDLRTSNTFSPPSAPACFAYIEAVRGLLQSHTLERGPAAPPANLVISSYGQHQARERTTQYLESPGGSFSRGATYDLREDVA